MLCLQFEFFLILFIELLHVLPNLFPSFVFFGFDVLCAFSHSRSWPCFNSHFNFLRFRDQLDFGFREIEWLGDSGLLFGLLFGVSASVNAHRTLNGHDQVALFAGGLFADGGDEFGHHLDPLFELANDHLIDVPLVEALAPFASHMFPDLLHVEQQVEEHVHLDGRLAQDQSSELAKGQLVQPEADDVREDVEKGAVTPVGACRVQREQDPREGRQELPVPIHPIEHLLQEHAFRVLHFRLLGQELLGVGVGRHGLLIVGVDHLLGQRDQLSVLHILYNCQTNCWGLIEPIHILLGNV